jgi:hypothetical protein
MRLSTASLLATAVLTFSLQAAADVVSPPEFACAGKRAGDVCTYGSTTGTCQDATCDQKQYLPDGGLSRTQVACERCTGPAPAGGSDSGGCSYGRAGSMLGALGIALCVPLLVRRRRKA